MLHEGQIFGKYKILELIGEGGMGVVYKAQDTKLERIVALKLISGKFAKSAKYQEKLSGEAKKAAQIDSDYIVKIWEYSEFENCPYISLEYVSGEDFRTAISKYTLPEKVQLTRQIAEGLKAAHAKGLIHRDLKPENIKLTQLGQVKIFDFGVAKSVKADTVDSAGNIEGTLFYMSPEQVSGADLTYSTDLFSFGIVLYELFTGQRPFKGEYAASIIYSILYENPTPPRELSPQLPKWLNVMIMKLLAKSPNERFHGMNDVLEFINDAESRKTKIYPLGQFKMPDKKATVIDIKNLSGDESWNYFCAGFTEDLIREISRRTRLIISAEPATAYSRDIREVFERCRSDFVVTGNLLKWQDNIKLSLSIYGSGGTKLIYGEQYQSKSEKIFEALSRAANDASMALASATNDFSCNVDQYAATDFSAYDYYLKGKSYYQTNKPDDLELAIKMYKKSLEVAPGFALAYTGLSDVYAFQYMAYYDRTLERIEQAKINAVKALEIDPRLPDAERSLGRYYMFTNDTERAEKAFLRAVEIDPKFAIGYRTLAWLKGMQGDQDTALQWANKALGLAPTDLETLLLISLMYLDQRKYTVALATLQRAIELGPDYGRAYYNLGIVYRKLGVFDLALENFLLAIKYKGDPNSYIDAGYIYMLSGDYKSALEKFKESIDVNHFPFAALYYCGLIEKLCQNEEQAVKYFDKSISFGESIANKDQRNLPVLCYKALALAASGRNSEAVDIVNELLEHCRDQGDILYSIARCFALMDDKRKADDYIAQAKDNFAGPSEKEIMADPHFRDFYQRF
jgi:serine/threonine protein kinase/Tfp pilus assembly protein PilF